MASILTDPVVEMFNRLNGSFNELFGKSEILSTQSIESTEFRVPESNYEQNESAAQIQRR